MYGVSQAYINKLFSVDTKRRRIRGNIDNTSFTENDVIANSLSLSKQLTASSDIKLGGVYTSQLTLVFMRDFASRVNRGSWRTRKITISVGLFLGLDENEQELWEDVPLGEFYIDEANHTAAGVEVKAYDAMTKFDKRMSLTSTGGHFYSMLTLACNRCGVPLGMTQAEVEELPNGNVTFQLYPDNDITNWRDFISWIAVSAGAFCTIDREGQLVLRTWKETPDLEIGINDRFTGGSYSDFSTYYSRLRYTNLMTKESLVVEGYSTGGLEMNIGANPFFQYGLKPYIESLCRSILSRLYFFNYVPFKVTSHIDPILDLGDVLEFTDGLAGDSSIGCVMKIDYSYRKGVTLEGFGKNPAIAGAMSAADKNIAGLLNNTENEMVYVKYVNAEGIYMGCDSGGEYFPEINTQKIGEVYLTATKDTNVEIHTRVIFEQGSEDHVSGQGQSVDLPNDYRLALIYKLDGETIARIPFSEDSVYTSASSNAKPQTIEDFHSYIGLETGNRSTLEVFLELTQANRATDGWCPTITIGAEGISLTVIGQGLSKEEEWDGVITASDSVGGFNIQELRVFPIWDDLVSLALVNNDTETFTDSVPAPSITPLSVGAINETSFHIYLRYEEANLLTESGDEITTENGDEILL